MNLTEVTVSRTIPAPAEKVFDVWINPKSPGGPWFGGEKLIFNAAVDGLFYSLVKHEGRCWPHYGRFIEIDRPRRVSYTWVSEATQGLESIVTLDFRSQGEDTEVILHHTNLPDDEMGRRHRDGWTWILDMLAKGMAARKKRFFVGLNALAPRSASRCGTAALE